ncbi:MAG: hypothetical protein HYY05_05810 [Chloroflexi bacterium]|nr:hypothetical protein [Chloroflexota bacterium]
MRARLKAPIGLRRRPARLGPTTLIAGVTGTLLLAINHGPALAAGGFPGALLWQIPLTYALSFALAGWAVHGAAAGSR